MPKHLVIVPRRLTLESSVDFACELAALPDAKEYFFDFRDVGRIEPFALLFLSSELQRYRSKRPASKFAAANFESCGYAAHMGFFKAFGLDHGKVPGEAKGSSTYIPITIFDSEELQKQAAENFEAVGAFIEGQAQEMAAILTRQDSGDLFDTLTYSIREIVRNVIEHSQSNQFGFCAQYWPTHRSVELAILDRGIGVKAGLSPNPNLEICNDHEALNLSLMPGISGKAYKGARQNPNDGWANSGYGLYMTSRLCREGGSFFIASGDTGLHLSESKRRYLKTPFEGTALKLTLKTDRLSSLDSMLSKYRKEAYNINKFDNDVMSASKASTMLSRDFR
ncbi:MAG: hypothetical protein ACXW02_08080 [Halobacteriota archaeon]